MHQLNDWQELNQQLDLLLDKTEAERQRFLLDIESTDPARAAQLTRLLSGIATSEPLEQLGAIGLVQEALQALESIGPGEHLGSWTLQQRIGRGGMAEVFKATRQVGGTEQFAALKLMAMGLGSEEQRRRFRQETAILARLQDSRLSRLIDAGAAQDGRPWLAMEYIEGQPIDVACAETSAGLRERVGMLIEVSRAVDYCHRSLVVHRDIKPSNVFVTAHGQVRLLDFGIAKVMEPNAVEGLNTGFAMGAYTLRFSSPEQLQSQATGVDCDVYQLGLLSFLLLTGQRAFEQHESEPLALLRAMREGAALPSGVCLRVGKPGNWGKQLAGDLDAILLRALEFDSAQRYAGARELADDLQNWLDGLPVNARSQTRWYRSRRYLRRHWLEASSAALIFLLISGYAATITWQSQRLAEQRNAAEAARQQAEAIRDFLVQVFGSVDPQSQLSRGKSIEQLLIEGVDRARTDYSDQPLMAAQLLVDMGDVLARRGRLESARGAFEDARRMRAAALGDDHPDTLAIAMPLGDVLYRLGEGEAALTLLRQHLQKIESVFGAHSDAAIDALMTLGPVESVYGDITAAEGQLQRALNLQLELYPNDLPAPEQPLRRAQILNQLAVVVMRAARYAEAAKLQQESLALYEKYAGALDSRTLESRKNLGFAYRMLKQPAKAQSLFEQTLHDERELYDGAHWQIAYTLGHLANLASDSKDYPRAIELWQQAEAETRSAMGDDYHWIASARFGQARSMLLSGRLAEGHGILLELVNSTETDPAVARLANTWLERFPLN